MSAQIIDGKLISKQILDEVKSSVAKLHETGQRPPCLAVIIVGNDPASKIYVNNKHSACQETCITSRTIELPEAATDTELLALIDKLNGDGGVDGILLQSPLPEGMDERKALLRIDPAKDVDGFHPYNVGLLNVGAGSLLPCTPAGVIELLKRSGIDIQGKRAVVLGRSNIVGKPAAALLLRENATVTICHSKTKDLPAVVREADIIVAAIGKKWFLTPDMVKDGAVIIDVGINRIPGSKKIYGDADPACADKASYMTPVPGGVGPMTVAMLMKNCLTAYNNRKTND